MKNHFYLALGLLIALGAGCVPTAPPASPEAGPLRTSELHFFCQSGKSVGEDFRETFDPLLKEAGWEQTGKFGVRVCLGTGRYAPALIITDDYDGQEVTKAAILLADARTKTITSVTTKDTSEMFGTSVIGDILAWRPDTITYRLNGRGADGGCVESVIRDQIAYQDITVAIATGAETVGKTCRYVSCEVENLSCEE